MRLYSTIVLTMLLVGGGTEVIDSGEDLESIDRDGEYVLTSDINASEIEPIGNKTHPFTGTIEGQGHTISGLQVSSNEEYVGLFRYANATIRNLTVENFTVEGRENTAVLVGYAEDGTEMENISVENGTIRSTTTPGTVAATIEDTDDFHEIGAENITVESRFPLPEGPQVPCIRR